MYGRCRAAGDPMPDMNLYSHYSYYKQESRMPALSQASAHHGSPEAQHVTRILSHPATKSYLLIVNEFYCPFPLCMSYLLQHRHRPPGILTAQLHIVDWQPAIPLMFSLSPALRMFRVFAGATANNSFTQKVESITRRAFNAHSIPVATDSITGNVSDDLGLGP